MEVNGAAVNNAIHRNHYIGIESDIMFRSLPLYGLRASKRTKPRIPSQRITKLTHPTLPELIESLPKPVVDYDADESNKDTWKHKNGYMMKFFRTEWRYPEPCYYTLTKYRPANEHQRAKVWGILTWQGQTEKQSKPIKNIFKKQWRYIPQQNWPPKDFHTLQDKLKLQLLEKQQQETEEEETEETTTTTTTTEEEEK